MYAHPRTFSKNGAISHDLDKLCGQNSCASVISTTYTAGTNGT